MDFWVCRTLDALYNRAGIKERLLFKGGTSLSKAFDLIQRFSEDIDITVFRDDLPGDPFPSDDELRAMGSNQRRRKLDEIKDRCSGYINSQFQAVLTKYAATELEGMKLKVEPDPDNPDAEHPDPLWRHHLRLRGHGNRLSIAPHRPLRGLRSAGRFVLLVTAW
ncbi:nucleotidyl transferase AbiEii/AbiGii toxin family protein [Bradyrhizobium sp. CCBAU 51753]|uniref:nucleotidyl transferase AbiEii/AbiGii toxin family protein n=1 Tax=Bradyrhizobium sp. CCBAU 51753 TaxID=1325100 RepID=UPI001FEEF069|nr:nucleotidyl transferase AbiEii/AbiGii toxin family protein [Bradyrhizobium sp. CCBAU 51753]